MTIRHHATIGHLYVPNIEARIPHEAGGYFVRTNAQGFRSDVDFEVRRRERSRILFFGGSNTAGDGCENEQRFPERVGELLDAEVYNYGLSGSSVDQQLLIFEELASDVEADLIVLGIAVEDVEQIRSKTREFVDRESGSRVLVPKPYFTLKGERLVTGQVPVPRERVFVDEDAQRRLGAGFANERPLIHRALTTYRSDPRLALLRNGIDEWAPALRARLLSWGGLNPHPDYDRLTSPGWRLMAALCKRFFEQAGATPVLVVPMPSAWFYLDGVRACYTPRFQSLEDRSGGRHVADVTTPLLALPRAQREEARFATDSHFTPAGHEHVAHFIAREISQRGLLREAGTPIPRRPLVKRPKKTQGAAWVLGISCLRRDAAAALVCDGEIVAAAQEDRFTRGRGGLGGSVGRAPGLPAHAINDCLEQAGIHPADLSAVVHHENASLRLERVLHTLAAVDDGGDEAFIREMPAWVHGHLSVAAEIRRLLGFEGPILQNEQHRSHAASGFLPSPFERAAVLSLDGVGEWATASIGRGQGAELEILEEMRFPHSLGLLQAAFSEFMGFAGVAGDAEMMGLARFGEPKYVELIRSHLIDIKRDGSIELDLRLFSILGHPRLGNERFAELFGGAPRGPDAPIGPRECDMARSLQIVTEEVVLRMAQRAAELTREKKLCLAGDVARNAFANGRLLREGPFDEIWIQPAAGNAGAALGAALDVLYGRFERPRRLRRDGRSIQGDSRLGPRYGVDEIRAHLETHGIPHRELAREQRGPWLAERLAAGQRVGLFEGRAEFGAQALGGRSILADARGQLAEIRMPRRDCESESFSTPVLSIPEERCGERFLLDAVSAHGMIAAPLVPERSLPFETGDAIRIGTDSARDLPEIKPGEALYPVQTVGAKESPAFHALLEQICARTGHDVVIHDALAPLGEPLALTPADAYRCLQNTTLDALLLGDFALVRGEPHESAPSCERDGSRRSSEPDETSEAIIEGLEGIYDDEFRRAVRRMRGAGALGVGLGDGPFRAPTTTWSTHRASRSGADPCDIFDIPSGLDAEHPNSRRLARAITKCWTHEAAAEELRPVVASLLELAARTRPAPDPETEDHESLDVIF